MDADLTLLRTNLFTSIREKNSKSYRKEELKDIDTKTILDERRRHREEEMSSIMVVKQKILEDSKRKFINGFFEMNHC
jgi:hypothetical protein